MTIKNDLQKLFKAWFIGDDLGTNTGYALAYGAAQCPEDLPRTWQWYDYQETGMF